MQRTFYAVEYAYGATVINNGTRADKVYEFTARKLRDVWVAAGSPNVSAAGYRAAAKARNPLVRNALDGAYDGDSEAWEIVARQRVEGSPILSSYADTVFADWSDPGHAKWVATASMREVVSWAKATHEAAQEA